MKDSTCLFAPFISYSGNRAKFEPLEDKDIVNITDINNGTTIQVLGQELLEYFGEYIRAATMRDLKEMSAMDFVQHRHIEEE